MCGFAGFIDRPNRFADPASVMASMSEAIRHRGPDGEGHSFDASRRIGLVHRRLAIQDPSEAGAQPMRSTSGRFEIVYNGEIYDFPERRADLEAAGHQFTGKSDTEVLLAGFETWGIEATLGLVDGMFAFAVVDHVEATVTLARDRAGQKPLLLAVSGEAIAFASDLRALESLPAPFADRLAGINDHALHWFLANGTVPWPLSIRPGVEQVAPGGLVEISVANGRINRRKWWSPSIPQNDSTPEIAAPCGHDDETLAAIRTSVHRRCRSDREIGVFLSGGLDSRLIAALAAETRPGIPAFTLAMPGGLDESETAGSIASALGLPHRIIRPAEAEVLDTATRIAEIADEPFADSSLIAVALLARHARKEIVVALGGDGGDELFGGYRRHRAAASSLGSRSLLRSVRAAARLVPDAVLDRIPMGRSTLRGSADLFAAAHDGFEGYLRLRATQGDAASLLDRQVLRFDGRTPRNPWDGLTPEWIGVRSMMAADFREYLPDDPLAKIDRGTMAVGLETRSPMLGREVIETASRIRTSDLFDRGGGRLPIRNALQKLGLASTSKKAGFAVPLAQWLRGPLREWAASLLLEDANDPIDAGLVKSDWTRLMDGRDTVATRLWTVTCWRAWLRSRP
jgi:asparagine synthase (glutamine-hydrolysing)